MTNRIGKNVKIARHTFGNDGFGFEKVDNPANDYDLKRPLKRKEHKFGIVIEDDVEIGACTCIDRGRWRDTVIGRGTKIDNLVHIAHNVVIGQDCVIAAGAVIGGSVTIGNNCFLGMGCLIKDTVKIGNNVIVGMGSVVLRDIPSNSTVIGNPARPLVKGQIVRREKQPKQYICGVINNQ